jgi:hypothetical protein
MRRNSLTENHLNYRAIRESRKSVIYWHLLSWLTSLDNFSQLAHPRSVRRRAQHEWRYQHNRVMASFAAADWPECPRTFPSNPMTSVAVVPGRLM